MIERASRKKLHSAELEAEIMKRVEQEPACAAITYVYVKATSQTPPEETWMHILVSRRPGPKTLEETKSLHRVLETMRREFDLVAE